MKATMETELEKITQKLVKKGKVVPVKKGKKVKLSL
jgi:hypothetical protein